MPIYVDIRLSYLRVIEGGLGWALRRMLVAARELLGKLGYVVKPGAYTAIMLYRGGLAEEIGCCEGDFEELLEDVGRCVSLAVELKARDYLKLVVDVDVEVDHSERPLLANVRYSYSYGFAEVYGGLYIMVDDLEPELVKPSSKHVEKVVSLITRSEHVRELAARRPAKTVLAATDAMQPLMDLRDVAGGWWNSVESFVRHVWTTTLYARKTDREIENVYQRVAMLNTVREARWLLADFLQDIQRYLRREVGVELLASRSIVAASRTGSLAKLYKTIFTLIYDTMAEVVRHGVRDYKEFRRRTREKLKSRLHA